ncbi:MAG: PEP-CTERM sorting domain-containing protein, partial [Pirellulales bacterium]|nr:PEP-CTERM sorting domain-containing protein [Pirellulales bacterium]
NFNEVDGWAVSEEFDRGAKDVLISYSDDGGATYQPLAGGSHQIALVQSLFSAECGLEINVAGQEITADHVRIECLNNWGDPEGYCGLGEVRFYGEAIVPSIPGDTDHDGDVDTFDAQKLAQNWGGANADCDFDDDGIVGPRDASIMAANWGYGTESASVGSVPEPSVLVVLLGMGAALLLRRPR